jgi:hypothetical protein
MNPIYASELFKNDGEIKRIADDIAVLRGEMEKLKKEAKQLNAQTQKLNGNTTQQREQMDQAAKDADKLNKEYKKLTSAMSQNSIRLEEIKLATREQNRENRLAAKQARAMEGSYDDLSAQYSLLKIQINKMSAAQRENTKEGQAAVKRSKELYEEMKRLQEETGKHQLNVGNYSSALDKLGGSFGKSINGAKGLGGEFAALVKSPLALTIGAVVGIVGALFKAFTRSEKGAQLMAKATGVVNGIMSTLTGIASSLFDTVMELFEDPVGAIKDFGRALLDNIINRFKAVADLGGALGKILGSLWRRDFEGVKEGATEAGQAITQMITGYDIEQQEKFAEAVRETAAELERNAKAFADLETAKRNNIRVNGELTKSAERLRTQEELAAQAAGDTTLSLQENLEALKEAQRLGELRAQAEIAIAKNQLSILNQEIRLREANNEDTLALYEQQVQAISAVKQAERELLIFRADTARQNREITRDAFERELDFAIDFYDAQKMVLERQANDTDRNITERAAAFQRLVQLDASAFEQQIKLVEDFTGERVRLNELALIDDERIVRERLRQLSIDDIAMGRILEILRERKAATQDILDIEMDLTREKAQQAQIQGTVELGAVRQLEQQEEALTRTVRRIAERNINQGTTQQSLYDRLGINIGDDEKQALQASVSFAIGQIEQLAQAKVDAANRAVAASEQEVTAAQAALAAAQREAQLGYAVNLQAVEQRLALAEREQEESLRQQRTALREQQRLESLKQASSLFTAAAKILSEVSFPFNLIAVGTMLGSFALTKIRARKLTQEFREGGYDILGGERHERGGTYLGTTPEGIDQYAEKGEGRAIFSRKAVRKYGPALPDLVDSINSGKFGERFFRAEGSPIAVAGAGIDTSIMEKHLHALRANADNYVVVDSHGRIIEKIGNHTTIYTQ